MQLSIIIVNYNVRCFLEQCLYSVERACRDINAEILVVDNNSSDGSQAYFTNRFPEVQFRWHEANVGYSKANNLALESARGEYVLFLNPDTLVSETCLENLLQFLHQQPFVGATGIRMIDGSGRYLPESKRGRPTLLTSLFKLTGLAGLFPRSRIFARYYLGHLSAEKNQAVDVLAGAFLMVRKKVLDQTGGLDERFFMYGEDIDLSYRIQQAGFFNYYFAESTIIHFKGESTREKGSSNYIKLFYGAMQLFVSKHYNGGTAMLYNGFIGLAISLTSITARFKRFVQAATRKTLHDSAVCTYLLIGNAGAIASAREILVKNNVLQDKILELTKTATDSILDSVEARYPSIDPYTTAQPIFCMNEQLPLDTVISLMANFPKTLQFGFHFEGSSSIVSSADKDTPGQCLS